jgi:hypothetical protein
MEAEPATAIDEHLDAVTSVTDEATAYEALGQVLAAVAAMNDALSAEQTAAARPQVAGRGLIEKLEDWIKRLVGKLTEIVKKLAKGTSFSLTVGTSVSVTINFPAMGDG